MPELMVIPPQTPMCWDYRQEQLCPLSFKLHWSFPRVGFIFINPFFLFNLVDLVTIPFCLLRFILWYRHIFLDFGALSLLWDILAAVCIYGVQFPFLALLRLCPIDLKCILKHIFMHFLVAALKLCHDSLISLVLACIDYWFFILFESFLSLVVACKSWLTARHNQHLGNKNTTPSSNNSENQSQKTTDKKQTPQKVDSYFVCFETHFHCVSLAVLELIV